MGFSDNDLKTKISNNPFRNKKVDDPLEPEEVAYYLWRAIQQANRSSTRHSRPPWCTPRVMKWHDIRNKEVVKWESQRIEANGEAKKSRDALDEYISEGRDDMDELQILVAKNAEAVKTAHDIKTFPFMDA